MKRSGTSITAEQIKIVRSKDVSESDLEKKSHTYYRVKFALADGVETSGWADSEDNPVTPSEVLDGVTEAKAWVNGMAYYVVDIEHFKKNSSDVNPVYAVIRNHSYQINVQSVVGLGTPVINDEDDIPTPVKPEDTETYIAAKINVLAWKTVSNNVVLGQ